MNKKLICFKSLRAKILSTMLVGQATLMNVAYAQEFSPDGESAIQSALKWLLKVGGWISIVLFIIGVLTHIGMDSGNSKNVIMIILGFVFTIFLVSWAVNIFNSKMNGISSSIFN
jgi:hypothetical protein